MHIVTKQMMERSRTGPLDWMMMWPMWSSMMTERFAEVKQDNEYVLQYIRENNITFSVVTFTNVFGFLGRKYLQISMKYYRILIDITDIYICISNYVFLL